MTSISLVNATWRTSRRSQSTNCVEVALAATSVGVRDSKDRGGPVLTFAPARWIEFVSAAKEGEFDRAAAGGAVDEAVDGSAAVTGSRHELTRMAVHQHR